MCLVSKINIPKISDKDIEVYKLLKFNFNTCKIHTPYHIVVIPKLPYRLIAKGKTCIEHYCEHYEITKGFIHAYTTLNEAEYSKENDYIIVRASIPANTPYFIGKDNDICAKEMYLKGVIDLQLPIHIKSLLIRHFPDIPIFEITSVSYKQINPSIQVEDNIQKNIIMLHLKLTQEQTYKLGWGIPDEVISEGNLVTFSGNDKHKGACVCAHCNNIIEGPIYYIPVLNDTLCEECFKDFDLSIAEEDKEYELNNYNRIKDQL